MSAPQPTEAASPRAPETDTSPAPRAAPPECTGMTASWCPVHGDCTCQRFDNGERDMCSGTCPLHGDASEHPIAPYGRCVCGEPARYDTGDCDGCTIHNLRAGVERLRAAVVEFLAADAAAPRDTDHGLSFGAEAFARGAAIRRRLDACAELATLAGVAR